MDFQGEIVHELGAEGELIPCKWCEMEGALNLRTGWACGQRAGRQGKPSGGLLVEEMSIQASGDVPLV